MPPVTPERSPPDSRITGADSPVTADSSTEAMPSTISPSAGIMSPASQTTRSPARRSGAGRGSSTSPGPSRRAIVVVRVLRRLSAWALPRPSASASAKLAKSTVSHSQMAIWSLERDRVSLRDVDDQLSGHEHRDDPHREDHGIAQQRARVELAERVEQRRASDRGLEQRGGGGGHQSLPVRASLSGPRARAGKKERAPTSRITPIRSPMKIGEEVGMLPLEAGRVLLRRQRAGQAERGQDDEEAAEDHRRAQEVVVVVGRRGQAGEGGAVVVPGRGERVEDLAEAVRPGVERAGEAVVDDRRDADR